jgi:ABC-type uncharacterized transport system ATPase subunit
MLTVGFTESRSPSTSLLITNRLARSLDQRRVRAVNTDILSELRRAATVLIIEANLQKLFALYQRGTHRFALTS